MDDIQPPGRLVTLTDVAREADVAVQTVFNHFATKEDLFFDGRAPWVDGLAAAVLALVSYNALDSGDGRAAFLPLAARISGALDGFSDEDLDAAEA